jgi:hypothetical protein
MDSPARSGGAVPAAATEASPGILVWVDALDAMDQK